MAVPFRAWPRSRQILLASLGVVALLSTLFWWRGERFYLRWLLESPSAGRCQKRLSRPTLDASLRLGTQFLLSHQRPAGNFDYEYDWRDQTLSLEDNDVRQAGALWGLTLLYEGKPEPTLAAAVDKGLAFFNENSRVVKGARCTVYPGSANGTTGTVALVALAHIEYLRSAQNLAAEQRTGLEKALNEYLALLLRNVHPSGLWYGTYNIKNCKPQGEPSPYSDGETLLALAKAAKYLGHAEVVPTLLAGAAAGKRLNIDEALVQDADSDTTKGFYQWSSMAFYELATSDIPGTSQYGDVVLRLADWMIDEHHVLTRTRNTGYAFEGLTHAYALAKQRNDPRAAKYSCVIDVGLERLISWQVGGPLPNRYTAHAEDARGVGGVQNEAFSPELRVDVTQHQMHATQLARQYVY